jgi:hypothetical protein
MAPLRDFNISIIQSSAYEETVTSKVTAIRIRQEERQDVHSSLYYWDWSVDTSCASVSTGTQSSSTSYDNYWGEDDTAVVMNSSTQSIMLSNDEQEHYWDEKRRSHNVIPTDTKSCLYFYGM